MKHIYLLSFVALACVCTAQTVYTVGGSNKLINGTRVYPKNPSFELQDTLDYATNKTMFYRLETQPTLEEIDTLYVIKTYREPHKLALETADGKVCWETNKLHWSSSFEQSQYYDDYDGNEGELPNPDIGYPTKGDDGIILYDNTKQSYLKKCHDGSEIMFPQIVGKMSFPGVPYNGNQFIPGGYLFVSYSTWQGVPAFSEEDDLPALLKRNGYNPDIFEWAIVNYDGSLRGYGSLPKRYPIEQYYITPNRLIFDLRVPEERKEIEKLAIFAQDGTLLGLHDDTIRGYFRFPIKAPGYLIRQDDYRHIAYDLTTGNCIADIHAEWVDFVLYNDILYALCARGSQAVLFDLHNKTMLQDFFPDIRYSIPITTYPERPTPEAVYLSPDLSELSLLIVDKDKHREIWRYKRKDT
ncbi:MAG: hypothetical protein PHY48_09765 [Candidatus Cloacimonetes bacterium]|nr:hypothetical protein [Candidatus Cloacimonadota bacterium]